MRHWWQYSLSSSDGCSWQYLRWLALSNFVLLTSVSVWCLVTFTRLCAAVHVSQSQSWHSWQYRYAWRSSSHDWHTFFKPAVSLFSSSINFRNEFSPIKLTGVKHWHTLQSNFPFCCSVFSTSMHVSQNTCKQPSILVGLDLRHLRHSSNIRRERSLIRVESWLTLTIWSSSDLGFNYYSERFYNKPNGISSSTTSTSSFSLSWL